jgi:ectoine hydroxylase-related dioxygenase (phytanoyl-CoA dioxygenase family)
MLYNIFHIKQLKHNLKFYKKIGLNKFYFSPISSKDFENKNPNLIVSEYPKKMLKETKLFQQANEQLKAELENFEKNGYAILPQFFKKSEVDAMNQEIDQLISSGKANKLENNKIMFAFEQSEALRLAGQNKLINEVLESWMGDKVQLFQSINFLWGSEQATHSDSIHMTTFPLGKLFGVWVALEDVDLDNGPLHYYPGSHHLPYYLNKDYYNEGTFFTLGNKGYAAYEKMIAEKIESHQLQKQIFTAKAGDVLIWHANLFHGGEPHQNKNKTRKSVVFHYYAENCICYHEISQRPALM